MNTSGNKTASRAGQAFGGTGDRIMSRVVFCVAVTGIVILIFILGFLIANGLPVLESTSLGEMFFSKDWYPTEEPPALGMVALIAGTLAATPPFERDGDPGLHRARDFLRRDCAAQGAPVLQGTL